jgi:hypothetical protein
MAGTAQTKSFLLSSATVMVGPQADLHKLNPAEHSIGLVKNFTMNADPTFVELTQGLKNHIVMSVKNGEGIRCSMEVYEYTLRNLAYAAGFDASGAGYDPVDTIWVTSAAIATNTVVEVASDITTDLAAGDYVFLQNGYDDKVHIAKVASAVFATSKTTVTFATGYETPVGASFPIGSRLGKVKKLEMGNGTNVQPELAAKIVGLLPKDNAPFTILLPRMKISKGFGVAFQTDNFGNLPFEFTPYAGTPEDPFYAEYGESVAVLFPR